MLRKYFKMFKTTLSSQKSLTSIPWASNHTRPQEASSTGLSSRPKNGEEVSDTWKMTRVKEGLASKYLQLAHSLAMQSDFDWAKMEALVRLMCILSSHNYLWRRRMMRKFYRLTWHSRRKWGVEIKRQRLVEFAENQDISLRTARKETESRVGIRDLRGKSRSQEMWVPKERNVGLLTNAYWCPDSLETFWKIWDTLLS